MDKRICKYETSNVLKYALLYYGALLIFFILGADFSRMERYNKHGKGIEY